MKSTLFGLGATAIIALCVIFATTRCTKELNELQNPDLIDPILLQALWQQDCDTFKLKVNNLQVPDQADIANGVVVVPGTAETTVDGYEQCTVQYFEATAGFSENSVLDPTSNVVYTGALVDGDSWLTGAYRTIIASRRPLTISISTQTNGSPKEVVLHPEKVSSFREALNNLLSRSTFSAPAIVSFDKDEVYSDEQARMLTGVRFSGWGAKVNAIVNSGSSTQKNKLMVRFIQKYFTIDMDDPYDACALFDTLPDLSVLQGTSPMYISSVTYGRAAYFVVSSSSSMDSVRWAVEASYSAFGSSGGGNIDSKAEKILKESSISAFIIGGSGDDAVKAINGIDDFKNYIFGGGNPSPSSPGAPIAYTMKYLKNREVAKVQLTSKYLIRNCVTLGEESTVVPGNNAGSGYYFCGSNIKGDHDFNGHGPNVNGVFKLEISEDRKEVWCKVDVTWTETSINDGSTAKVEKKFHVYTAPNGKYIAALLDNTVAYFNYTDDDHTPDYPGTTGAGFITNLKVVGDTNDDDMECNGDEDCHVSFKLKPFKVSLKPG